MISKEIYIGQYLINNNFNTVIEAWQSLKKFINKNNYHLTDIIKYDTNNYRAHIQLNGFPNNRYINVQSALSNSIFIRANVTYSLKFNSDFSLKLIGFNSGINLDIVFTPFLENTEILVQNTFFDSNIILKDLKYAFLKIEYHREIHDKSNAIYSVSKPIIEYYPLCGIKYKRLYFLDDSSNNLYIVNNINLKNELNNNKKILDQLIDSNNSDYIITLEKTDEYIIYDIFKLSLYYSDITTYSVSFNDFIKYKIILENLNMYNKWFEYIIKNN